MKLSKHAARLQVWQQRLSTYVSMINFAMLFYLYIIESPMGLEWYHWISIIAVLVLTIIFIDTKYILPGALEYKFKKNPGMNNILERIDNLEKKIDLVLKKDRKVVKWKKQ